MGIRLKSFVDQVRRLPTRSRLVLIAIALPGIALLTLGSGGLAVTLVAAAVRLLRDGVAHQEAVLVFAAGSALALLTAVLIFLTAVLGYWALNGCASLLHRE